MGAWGLSPSPPPAAFTSLSSQGQNGDRWTQLEPSPTPTWASFPGKRWDPEQDCFMQIPISVCRQSLEDERRNNYQIMHVALPFLNPEPLKEKGKKKKKKQQTGVGCVLETEGSLGPRSPPEALLSWWSSTAVWGVLHKSLPSLLLFPILPPPLPSISAFLRQRLSC